MTTQSPDIGPPASGTSINGLILNIVIPGLGSIIGGKSGLGAGQMAMAAVGVLLVLFSIWPFSLFRIALGALLWLAAVVWGITTGIQMMSESTSRTGPPPGVNF